MTSTGIEALAKWREEHPEGVGPQRNPYQKWQDHDTRKTAIEAMCWQCMGGTATEVAGIRASIRDCTSNGENGATRCPLYNWRPYK